jgi:hypothetical protein
MAPTEDLLGVLKFVHGGLLICKRKHNHVISSREEGTGAFSPHPLPV